MSVSPSYCHSSPTFCIDAEQLSTPHYNENEMDFSKLAMLADQCVQQQLLRSTSNPESVMDDEKNRQQQTIPDEEILNTAFIHPLKGCRKIAQLLSEKTEIFISEYRVQSCFKKHNLQNSKKRIKAMQDKAKRKGLPLTEFQKKQVSLLERETPSYIQILNIAIQHPSLGCRRLIPFLEKEGFSATHTRVQRCFKYYDLEDPVDRKKIMAQDGF